jgi:hypothetical protein
LAVFCHFHVAPLPCWEVSHNTSKPIQWVFWLIINMTYHIWIFETTEFPSTLPDPQT